MPRSNGRTRPFTRWARVLVALLSTAALAVTGYGWSAFRQLDGGLVTSDVLGGTRPTDGATDILLVGLDSRTDARGNPLPRDVLDQLNAGDANGELNTDTLILVRIPSDPARVSTAVSIPRDSYVSVPGFGTHKINSAYARAMNETHARLQARGVTGADLAQQSSQAGRRLLIQTVEQLTGASVDHYAEVNLAGFAEITHAVGGIPVCLNAPVHDSFSGANFPAGPQSLEGAAGLAFVRQRHGLPRGDLDRIVRQQAFMASLAHKVLSAGTLGNPSALSGLIAVVSKYVVLDQGWDLMGFAGQAQGLTGGNIQFRTIPTGRPDLPTPSDGTAVQIDPTTVKAFYAGLTGGTPPAAADPAPAQGPPVTVDVANGTKRTGLAAAALDALGNQGFVPGKMGNTTATTRSLVRTATADQDAARRVAQLLGGLRVQRDETVQAGRISVVLGRDYAGPATTPASRGSGPAGAAVVTPTAPAGDDAPGAPPADGPVITADGVPCVN
ncbi:LCP family protein [Pseudonocardia acidicola]|uniref:LCP family protein n=1 Tax=Pseudonocardia acidicola TaxID=2724939 RepID=A0ABX1SGS0_9PSEU|nr:LCP family protein [Pseudonocardia acidicola]NMI00765.1 LCP family protein [Pseudonocardia acidicola]